MDNNQIIILIDGIIYLITFLYWLLKLRKINIGLIILAIMTFSHMGSLFYYTVLYELGLLEADIQIIPFVYLYLLIMLCLLPFLRYEGIKKIDDEGCRKLISFITIFLIIINLEPLMENLILLRSSGKEDYSDLYKDLHDGILNIYSNIGATLIGWLNHFNLFVPILFFYHLSKTEVNKIYILGLGLCMLNSILYWINIGGRGGIVSQFLLYFLTFVYFEPVLSRTMISKVKKISILVSIPAVIAFMAITISRYEANSEQDKSLAAWLLLYTSEGPIKFNTEMWEGPHNTNGDVNANFIKDKLGMKTYKTYEERDEYYLAKNDRRIEVFYTYIGDFVSDYSYYGTIFICLMIYILERKLLKGDGVMPIHYLIFLVFFSQMLAIGFASNMYREYSLQKSMFYMAIVFCFFVLAKRNNKPQEVDTIV